VHLVITDSGLGGLTICAGIEQWLRRAGRGAGARLTYVNAWPEEGRGYNDLPGLAARAAVFDRALRRIDGLAPDRIVIACNTLSIVYEHTAHRWGPHAPVRGIVDAGVELFAEALGRAPDGALVLLGTRTTIDSGVHRDRLMALGVSGARVSGASCHGLATAIERGPASDATAALIETCAGRAAAVTGGGTPLFIGLCCTHYGMVGQRLRAAVQARTGGTVEVLDPNARLVADVVHDVVRALPPGREVLAPLRQTGRRDTPEPGGGGQPAHPLAAPVVRMLSKVALPAEQREAVAAMLEDVSPAAAAALRACEHVPDLF
jgi:glutamate racemase